MRMALHKVYYGALAPVRNATKEGAMLKCPKCETAIQFNFLPGSEIKDMVDLSRQARATRASLALTSVTGAAVGVVKCEACGYEGDPLEFDQRSLLPKVVECNIHTNGMVSAFDSVGNQVTECQGFILVVASELKIRCDENTEWNFAKWDSWRKGADFSWWFQDE